MRPAPAVGWDWCQTAAVQIATPPRRLHPPRRPPAASYERRLPRPDMAYASPRRERRTCRDCLTQGHGLSHDDAHLFAQVRTFRIIQFNGFNGSTGSIDLTARASAILATAPQIFI